MLTPAAVVPAVQFGAITKMVCLTAYTCVTPLVSLLEGTDPSCKVKPHSSNTAGWKSLWDEGFITPFQGGMRSGPVPTQCCVGPAKAPWGSPESGPSPLHAAWGNPGPKPCRDAAGESRSHTGGLTACFVLPRQRKTNKQKTNTYRKIQ